LLEDLQAAGALPGDDVRMVERVDQHRPGRGRELVRRDEALVHRGSDELDLRPICLGGGDLGHRRPVRHVDLGVDAQQLRGERHALGVVPGARRDDPACLLGVREAGHARVGAADLERPSPLKVLALEEDLGAHLLRQGPRVLERRRAHHAGQEPFGGPDVVGADGK
jgi:hypothetical protein